ncbi:hypothetical protein CHS0354_029894 [Potamilus streckersoni]|uniref:MAGE domain-containing protein n=1 Tax=Potamilus streckersoni TaxID=2493646 RepID=A0AAE0RSS3_9BIVA|nr:hypothetical protein CHS0354_029894 [Potamilus streckersoni]
MVIAFNQNEADVMVIAFNQNEADVMVIAFNQNEADVMVIAFNQNEADVMVIAFNQNEADVMVIAFNQNEADVMVIAFNQNEADVMVIAFNQNEADVMVIAFNQNEADVMVIAFNQNEADVMVIAFNQNEVDVMVIAFNQNEADVMVIAFNQNEADVMVIAFNQNEADVMVIAFNQNIKNIGQILITSAISFAKSRSVCRFDFCHGIPKSSRSMTFCITKSITIRKRKGDRIHPCMTQDSMEKEYVVPSSVLTQQLESRSILTSVNIENIRDSNIGTLNQNIIVNLELAATRNIPMTVQVECDHTRQSIMPPKAKKQANDRDGTTSSQAAGPSQTMNQAVKAAASMDRGEIERKTNDLVQYLLIMDQKKIPIKKQDINKHVLKDASKAFPVIFEKATERLEKLITSTGTIKVIFTNYPRFIRFE